MRALQFRTYGGPEVLEWAQAPAPHAGQGQIRIAVRAARMNPIDCKASSGAMAGGQSGPSTLAATLQVLDPPSEITWTGTTMAIKAVHVFGFQANDGGTLAGSEESWQGLLASLLKGYSRKTLDKEIRSVLSHLKAEAERRAATA
jgi:hypothetical protein